MKHQAVWFASILHIIWAALLIASISPTTVTGINLLHVMFPNRYVLACVLLGCSISAILSITKFKGTKSLAMLLPQQFLLIIPAIAVIAAISNGHFADGVIRSREFLLADKVVVILIALFHTQAILRFDKGEEI